MVVGLSRSCEKACVCDMLAASVMPYPCRVVGLFNREAKVCECADGLNSFGLPVISFQAYEGFVAALAQAGTSLAGIEVGLF